MAKLFWSSLWGLTNETIKIEILCHCDAITTYMFFLTCKRFNSLVRQKYPTNLDILIRNQFNDGVNDVDHQDTNIVPLLMDKCFTMNNPMTGSFAQRYFQNEYMNLVREVLGKCKMLVYPCPNTEKRLQEMEKIIDRQKIRKFDNKIKLLQFSFVGYIIKTIVDEYYLPSPYSYFSEVTKIKHEKQIKVKKIINGILIPTYSGFQYYLLGGRNETGTLNNLRTVELNERWISIIV